MSLNPTEAGAELLTRALAGTAVVNFTHIQIGSGTSAGDSPSALRHVERTLEIQSSAVNGNIVAVKSAALNNGDITSGFRVTELGLFAEDPDDSTAEILFAYAYVPTESADYVPAYGDRSMETEYTIEVYIGGAASVVPEVVSGIYATQADLTAHINDTGKHIRYVTAGRIAGETLGNCATAEGEQNVSSGNDAHTEGSGNIASGARSHAEGTHNTASGDDSHAEGEGNTASGGGSHAEGGENTASGLSSHAEGLGTTASGNKSHAEGGSTTAGGVAAHAEGQYSTAAGDAAHAEGESTEARGDKSHAEGIGTIANSRSQHVFGEYNLADMYFESKDQPGKYVEIVGNGSTVHGRSNARTLDWEGNETLAGKLRLGAGPTEDMDAATKKYVDDVDAVRVGDIKVSMAAQSNKWLECDGSTISSAAYADLIQLLRSQPQIKNLKIPPINTSIPSGTELRPVGVCYHDGVWVVCGCLNDGNQIDRPMIYTTNNIYGEWTEVRLSMDDQYELYGVCYDEQWDEWIAYGLYQDANQVRYPYFFHAADPTGSWTGVQLSTDSGIIASGTYENGTLILTVNAPGNVYGSQVYSNSGTGKTAEAFSASAAYQRRFMDSCHYADGVWVACGGVGGIQGGLHYATNPIGEWTDIDIGADCYAFAVCYCDGTWVAVGDQEIDGERYKRIWSSTDLSIGFSDCGISGVGRMEDVFFDNGVIVAVAMDGMIYTSTDCSSFAPLQSRCGAYATIYRMNSIEAANGTFVICHESGASAVYLAQSGAVLPDITPEYGKAYIRALP